MIERTKAWARSMKRDVVAVYLALRDPRTPWAARVVGAVVVAYALSPIDLVPDFVPVLGYLDDLVLVPLGIWLVVRLIPPPVLAEARARAEEQLRHAKPTSWAGAALVATIWTVGIAVMAWWVWHSLRGASSAW